MKKKIIVLFTSLLLMIPVITVPVHAEDVTLYWDGLYYTVDTSAVLEDGSDTSLWNSAQRYRFSVRPTHSIVQKTIGAGSRTYVTLFYYWYLGTSTSSNLSTYQTYFNDTLKPALSSSVHESVNGSSNTITTETYSSNNFTLNEILNDDNYYYYVSTSMNINYALRAGHIALSDSNNINGFLLAANLVDRNSYHYVSSVDFFNEVDNSGYTKEVLRDWQNSDTHPLTYFSTKVKNLMSGGVILPSGGTVTNPDPDPTPETTAEPTADPTADPSEDPTVAPTNQQQQQQYQTISENAVNVTVTENDVISEETIQRLDQTLQNNNPYQTSFQNAITTIDGFRQIGIKFAQTSESFLSFLPDWVLTLLSAMFVLLFFFIILRLLKVFHG